MEAVYGILGLAVLIGLAILLGKVKDAGRKAVNTKVLYKKDSEEGQHFVRFHLQFETTATISGIMEQLNANVMTGEVPRGVKSTVYISAQSANRRIYAFGNRVQPKSFEADVVVNDQGVVRVGIFRVMHWTELDGLIAGQEQLKKLRHEVKLAFHAADASVRITEIPSKQ